MKQGFELNINGHKYRFRCDGVSMTKTKNCFYSNNVNLQISVFDEDNNRIKLDGDSYVAEKVSDFIRNCINGQDSCYWDWYEPNRHLKDKSE